MVERKEYLDQLWAWKDERQIKVVTGIRRCGKSVLLEQYQQRLLANGVAPEQIISINFENLDYEPLKDYMRLYNYLKERLCVDKMTYIFLDEVQEVPSFEKVVDSLYIRDHVDVYITGSNAYMLSSELATLLSGRYTEIKMLPLSFREYIAVTGMAKEEAFAEFMKTGGIPYVAVMNRTDEKIDQYLEGIYNTVIVKDIEQRQTRREKESGKRKITDIALLKTIARYLASVIGSPVSMKSITDYLISAGRKVSQNTVSDYVEALTESFVFYPVERFDIVGKQLLKVNNKFYMVDMHYPVFCYNGQFRRGADGTPLTYMLHGHIHKSEDQVLVDRFSTETRAMMRKSAHQETAQPVPCQMINCFCMYSDYTPLTLEEWVECDQRRRDKADR